MHQDTKGNTKHSFRATSYRLQSVATGKIFDDSGWLLDAPGETEPTLIRAIYESRQLDTNDLYEGLYKYACWLPVSKILEGSSAPVTYQSKGLANYLKLSNLFVTFSGWWPERGATMQTCSFKETEAYSVCARAMPGNGSIMVIASAGNTARSFAKVCSDNQIPLLICMPADTIDSMWFDRPLDDCVKLIVTEPGTDYYDAIHLSGLVCRNERFFPEGGAKNVARRDGMGTTVLSAASFIGEIPHYYFQAIGSGTGAIAAWEANLRLLADGRFGKRTMKLILSQNLPFTPIMDAWAARSRHLPDLNEDVARKQISQIDAKVLSNRRPPYPPAGGLYDALLDTDGEIDGVSNHEAREAAGIFKETEGIDIHAAAAVATASLIRYAKQNRIDRKATIMLNITGGGEELFRNGRTLWHMTPSWVFKPDADQNEVQRVIFKLWEM